MMSKIAPHSDFSAWFHEPLALLLTGPCATTDLGQEMAFQWTSKCPVTVLFEKSRTPSFQELAFISTIIQKQSACLESASKFLLQELNSRSPAEIDASQPQLIFRLDDMWEVQFPNALADETGSLGVVVFFKGSLPMRIEILEAEAWFDSETGEWTPA